MSTVTKRIRDVKQPWGGYLKPSEFTFIEFEGGLDYMCVENISAAVVGIAVEYLTRYSLGATIDQAFRASREGYQVRCTIDPRGVPEDVAIDTLLGQICGLDDDSIVAACRAVTYDAWLRNPIGALTARQAEQTRADRAVTQNIRIMVQRSLRFWEIYGPVTSWDFTFDPKAYTKFVTDGEGDFLTRDAVWDFKVSEKKPTSKHTLQLLMYWIMGQHSGDERFRDITKLGIFNPRMNCAWLLDTADIPAETIETVAREVIGYR